jgi:hypothetical protein
LLEARSIIELRRSERGHPDCVAIARVLEEHAEITIFELAKDKLSRALRHGRSRYLLHDSVKPLLLGLVRERGKSRIKALALAR